MRNQATRLRRRCLIEFAMRTRPYLWLAVSAAAVVAAIAALCALTGDEHRRELPLQTYRAYGQTWTYAKVEINTQYLGLFSGHGLIGTRNAYREIHTLTDASGTKIDVADRLYALQRDGRYRKITCCAYFRERADLYEFDGRLVLVFSNARRFITDCFIHPAGRPGDEVEPDRGKRIGYIKVYAAFDPATETFKVDQFEDSLTDTDVKAEEARFGRQLLIPEHEALAWRYRQPFRCTDPRARPATG
jgi:hypothetical protein